MPPALRRAPGLERVERAPERGRDELLVDAVAEGLTQDGSSRGACDEDAKGLRAGFRSRAVGAARVLKGGAERVACSHPARPQRRVVGDVVAHAATGAAEEPLKRGVDRRSLAEP